MSFGVNNRELEEGGRRLQLVELREYRRDSLRRDRQCGDQPDHALNQQLRRIAAEHDIPCQLEILGRGGTDASAIQSAGSGVPATALSIPVRYAHTVNETCAVTDVEAAIDLLTRYLRDA